MKRITLAGCAIIKDNSILLLHRTSRNCFEMPGGKVEDGETHEQAAIREFKEELNCDVELVAKLGEREFGDNQDFRFKNIWFQAVLKPNQTPIINEPQTFNDLQYILLNDLPNYDLSSNMQNFLTELQKRNIKFL